MNQQVDNALGGYEESVATVGGGSNSQDADVGDLVKPAPEYTAEADIEAMAEAMMGFLFEACQPNEGGVFGFMDDLKMDLAAYMLSKSPVHAELTRVKVENERLREALEYWNERYQGECGLLMLQDDPLGDCYDKAEQALHNNLTKGETL